MVFSTEPCPFYMLPSSLSSLRTNIKLSIKQLFPTSKIGIDWRNVQTGSPLGALSDCASTPGQWRQPCGSAPQIAKVRCSGRLPQRDYSLTEIGEDGRSILRSTPASASRCAARLTFRHAISPCATRTSAAQCPCLSGRA